MWLSDAPRHSVDEAIPDFDRAFQNFFAKRTDIPQFKRKGKSADSFRYPDQKQIKVVRENGRISLPKLGWLRYRDSRTVLGEVRNVTVSSKCGKWFVPILTKREVDQPVPHGPAVGVDVGITRFATMSEGTFIAPLASFKKHEQRLAKYQRRMSSKTTFSNSWKRAKARVQRIHARIANARGDFLHQAFTTISKNRAMVCIEDLQVLNMSKSAAGTADAPGTKVAQKRGRYKATLEQGWFEFRRQFEYKMAWRGGYLVAVPAAYTRQMSSSYGHVSKENRKTQALFACVLCGYSNNADHVGAINVLERGQRLFACGGMAQSGRPSKQEPTEVTQAIPA
ncbi:RNA-guided endonuclease InsQ/TnpB family protein [Caballeronia sordidicola]|uniref:RNA-guided endonuclease InsQ/TnpB family protein n=1 Tax=Caballeronia sordidicola TaxID=196367 RepID=UPI0026B4DA8E|nr:transposase [Caballeronia sordidicola]